MKKAIVLAAFVALAPFFAFAQDDIAEQEELLEQKKSPHAFSLFTDFAYYPYSGPVAGNGERFAPISGAFDGVQLGVTGVYNYTIPLPGSKPLTKDNYLKVGGEFQISPATLMPSITASYSPIAFLVFNTRFTTGTGWEVLGSQGLASYNAAKGEYENLTPFKHWFYEFSLGGTFQFDAAALWPGDWHHIVFMASYEFRYNGMSGMANGDPWCWAADYHRVNGPYYFVYMLLGYQMPKLKVKMAGVQAEFKGCYSDGQFDSHYKAFDGDFLNVSLSPFVVVELGKNDNLFILLYFDRRRGFDSKQGKVNGRDQSFLEMNCSGGEWYFRRIALRYIHSF